MARRGWQQALARPVCGTAGLASLPIPALPTASGEGKFLRVHGDPKIKTLELSGCVGASSQESAEAPDTRGRGARREIATATPITIEITAPMAEVTCSQWSGHLAPSVQG